MNVYGPHRVGTGYWVDPPTVYAATRWQWVRLFLMRPRVALWLWRKAHPVGHPRHDPRFCHECYERGLVEEGNGHPDVLSGKLR